MSRPMRLAGLLAAVGVVATAGTFAASYAGAQDAPESLLPPGFDDPAPTPTPVPPPPPPSANQPQNQPQNQPGPGSSNPGATVQPLPTGPGLPDIPTISEDQLAELPSLEELEAMSGDELDDLLGLKPKFDIPPAARRALSRVGLLASSEGGMPAASLARQPASLVRAALEGNRGPMVSRWGHIMLRRVLASRLTAPDGMDPVEFAALRAGLLNRIGEFPAARAVAQDVDTGNWNNALIDAALEAYVATADFVGACPVVRLRGGEREDPQWVMLQAICAAYAGEGSRASSQLDRALGQEIAPTIDVLLAQRFAGAAGRGRRAVDIEWEEVEELNPWRFGLAYAVGEPIPESLLEDAGAYYQRAAATGPMVPLGERAGYAARAASEGILSSRAMVDLYSRIYADDGITGDPADLSTQLRNAYVAPDASDRLAAMQEIWGGSDGGDYSRYVLTAYAAARMPNNSAFSDASDDLIASMLTAGLDRDALNWADVVDEGSLGWALIALSQAERGSPVGEESLGAFVGNDESADQRKSAFLVAGLAGLGRIDANDRDEFGDDLGIQLSRETKWSRLIGQAADAGNPTLTALLAGLGMQGSSWSQMTPRHLYHIVSALNQVGLSAEARMIAAEAVARG